MHYRIEEPEEQHAARVFREVRSWLSQDKGMQRHRERLMKLCCAPQPPVSTQGTPRPKSLAA